MDWQLNQQLTKDSISSTKKQVPEEPSAVDMHDYFSRKWFSYNKGQTSFSVALKEL